MGKDSGSILSFTTEGSFDTLRDLLCYERHDIQSYDLFWTFVNVSLLEFYRQLHVQMRTFMQPKKKELR